MVVGCNTIQGWGCLILMTLLTFSLKSSSMAFCISPIVVFIIQSESNPCLVFTHPISPVPRLVSIDVNVLVFCVLVAMILSSLLGIGLFNSPLLMSKIGRWFFESVLLLLLKALSEFFFS